ncbi:hypothetical protein FNV43_RR04574 [Rhamnella rubrinervis]|uniref:Zinc knuckle CX2CX4HX4C domain-containing protein n=1 Tax=Rhamnella rubrinervis TaxID=2594499 RepID=A0A8K0HJU4_9ROSA|nr:hypothetical protein FNV43_RR04574 [Rhamnella rubrinervis]
MVISSSRFRVHRVYELVMVMASLGAPVVMAKFILDWKCLDGLDNVVVSDNVGAIAKVGNRGNAVMLDTPIEVGQDASKGDVPMQGILNEAILMQDNTKQPSFAFVVSGGVHTVAFDPAWEIGGMNPPLTVNKLGINLVTNSNAGSTKLTKSFGIAGVDVEAVYNKGEKNLGNWMICTPNYKAYGRKLWLLCYVLIDMDLAGFIPEKLLLETTDDCIEVELYFESFSYFCISCHSVGHPVGKCRSVIGKVPHKDGSHANEKENKAPVLNQVYKPKQVPPQSIKSTTPFVPTTNAFEVLNTEVTPAHIEDMTPSHHFTVPHQVTLWADAFGDLGDEPDDDDYPDDFGEDEWLLLQGEGSSKPSNEFDDTLYRGQQLNTMAMVPFQPSGALTAAQ